MQNPSTAVMRLVTAAALSLASATCLAQGAGYPARPIHVLVGFPAGGPTDVLARIIGEKLAGQMGQPIIVENRPGAAGNIAAEQVAKAAPDGYTILYSSNAIAISPALYAKLGFDPLKDLAPVTETGTGSLVMLVHPSVPVNSVKEFIDYAKQRPGQLNYASSGSGTITHLAAVLFSQQTGIQTQHVPYKGSAPSLVDLVAGRVQFLMGAINTALPFIKEGKLRPLAVTGLKRSAALPDVKTLNESDLPGFEASNWQGVFAPGGTPPAIVARLNAEFVRAVRSPDLKPRLAQQDMDPTGTSVEEFGAAFRAELARWAKVAKEAGIKAE
jgi:tripartite-type tricarboxylate transporter receptor subunit TctC